MSETEIYECKCGSAHHRPKGMGLPNGWKTVKIRGQQELLCSDCVEAIQESVEGHKPLMVPSSQKRIGITAVAMPTRGMVSLRFPQGAINLTLEESEAIAGALIPANLIMHGKHPAQAGGAAA